MALIGEGLPSDVPFSVPSVVCIEALSESLSGDSNVALDAASSQESSGWLSVATSVATFGESLPFSMPRVVGIEAKGDRGGERPGGRNIQHFGDRFWLVAGAAQVYVMEIRGFGCPTVERKASRDGRSILAEWDGWNRSHWEPSGSFWEWLKWPNGEEKGNWHVGDEDVCIFERARKGEFAWDDAREERRAVQSA